MGKIQIPNSIVRSDSFPLDSESIFYSLSEAQEYAADWENRTSYVGQVISVVETNSGETTVEVYKINENRELEKLGSGDNFLTEDVVISGETGEPIIIAPSGTSIADAIAMSVEYSLEHGGLIKNIIGDNNIDVAVSGDTAVISLKAILNPEITL